MKIEKFPETPEEFAAFFAQMTADREARKGEPPDVMMMGYHHEYLQSNLWRRIKRRILKRDNKTCRCCGGIGTHVHHRAYTEDVMKGENDSMLAAICPGCHNLIHFTSSGNKRSVEDTDTEFLTGQRQQDIPKIEIALRCKLKHPSTWSRMTAVQRSLWSAEYHRLRELKKASRSVANSGQKRISTGFFKPELWLNNVDNEQAPSE